MISACDLVRGWGGSVWEAALVERFSVSREVSGFVSSVRLAEAHRHRLGADVRLAALARTLSGFLDVLMRDILSPSIFKPGFTPLTPASPLLEVPCLVWCDVEAEPRSTLPQGTS